MKQTTPITITVPRETVQAIDEAAARSRRSRANLVRVVLEQWLENAGTRELARETLTQMDESP